MEDNIVEEELIDTEDDTNGEDEAVDIQEIELDETTIQMLKQNDPSINYLTVELNCDEDSGKCPFFNSIDWKRDGDCIANNTHLRTIEISHYGHPYILGEQGLNLPTRQQLQDFFSCLYRNRSIQKFFIWSINVDDEFGGGLIEGLQGHPSLTRLQVSPNRIGSMACIVIGKVLKHPTCKLRDLRLSNCHLDDIGLGALCDGLLGNRTMKKLDLMYNKDITSVGWKALSTVLQHPNCKLVELDLNNTEMNDESADVLGTALASSSVSTLYLSNNKSISSAGWQAFMNQLSRAPIEKLNLHGNNIDANGLAALASTVTLKSLDLSETKIDDTALALLANLCGTMKSFVLSSNYRCTPTGWQSFFNSLRTRGASLETFGISPNRIGDLGAIALGGLLSNMNTLKNLHLDGMSHSFYSDRITSQGWVSLFTTLQGSNFSLIKLDLSSNNIDDEGIQLLIRLVSSMTSLKELNLGMNFSVTLTGWLALTGYLQRPNCASEVYLKENKINDDTVVAFASALEQNKTLKWLCLHECTDEDGSYSITERGWEAVSTLVCNKTSIMDTYNSNHTLFVDSYDDDELLPGDLSSLLDLNWNKDKAEVARQKILQSHFSDTSNIQELLSMELEMIPTAIEWIGRPKHIGWEGKNVSGLSTMFNLVRRLPDLFDSNVQKKPSAAKRKRKDQ